MLNVRLAIGTIFCIILSVFPLRAEYYFEITPGVEEVYHAAWSMNFEKSYRIAERAKAAEPENLLIHHVENYIDFLRIFLADDMSQLEQFREDVVKRLDMIQLGDPTSPYYYFSQAEIYLQWSLVRGKNKETIRAGWDINRANKLLKKCKKEHPDFRHVEKSLAVIHALMGSVKGFKKGVIKVFTSLDGSIELGLKEINALSDWSKDHPSLWNSEISSVKSIIHGHLLKDWNESYQTIQMMTENDKNSPLGRFLVGSIAYKAGRNEEAIDWLTLGHDQHSFSQLDYLAGCALLNRQDEKASFYFEKFLKKHRGQNLIKAAYQKLSWYSLIVSENQDEYQAFNKHILTFGNDDIGEDREAFLAAESGVLPNKILLKTRLLFDGGYYAKAKLEIQKFSIENKTEEEIIESIYRKARIHHKLEEYDEALEYYALIIDHHSKEEQYYSCNASLQMAQIYFDQAKFNSARLYADVTLKINPSSHKESLHNEAKLLKELIVEGQ